ncbi:MAG: TolC family protein [Chitinophagales bacterium]|nr:TolC family protein [Chitinophagales bacterium]
MFAFSIFGTAKIIKHLRPLFLAATFFCLFTDSLFAQKVWTLEECIAYAKDNNISIRQSELTQHSSEDALLQSKLSLLPNINGSVNYYFNFGRTLDPTTYSYRTQSFQNGQLTAQAGWDIFNGFQRQNTIKKNQFDLLASQFTTETTVNNVLLFVVGGFLNVVYAKENLKIAQGQLQLSNQQLTRTQALVSAGTLSEGSLYNIQAQEANDELNQVTAQNTLDIAKLNLAQLLNVKDPIDVTIADVVISNDLLSELNVTVDSVYKLALQIQPQIKSAEYQVKSSEKSFSIAKGAQYPALSLFGSLSTNYSNAKQITGFDSIAGEPTTIGYLSSTGDPVLAPNLIFLPIRSTPTFTRQFNDNFGEAFGISLNIPIFNNWQTRTNVSRSRINLLNQQLTLESTRQQLYKDVQTAYTDAVAAKNKYTASLKSVASLQKAFDDAQRRFNLGAITSLDYITAQNNLLRSTSELLQSKYQYIFKLKELEFYEGKPLTMQ